MALYNNVSYQKNSKIGKGSYSEIYSCQNNGVRYACKRIEDDDITDSSYYYLQEIGCLALCNKLGIKEVPCVETIKVVHCNLKYHVNIYMELFKLNLFEYASCCAMSRRIDDFSTVYDNCIKALATLHSLNIVHADIKNANILVSLNSQNQLERLCLADYSIASDKPRDLSYTDGYRAPYLFNPDYRIVNKRKRNDIFKPSFQTDIYALGCSLVAFINDVTYYDNYQISIELNNTRRNVGTNPCIDLIDKLLDLEVDIYSLPNYKHSTFDTKKFNVAIDPFVVLDIKHLGEEFECDESDINMAIDIVARYLHVAEKDPLLYYSAYIIALQWGNCEYAWTMTEYIKRKVDDIVKLNQFILNVIEKLDGLIYVPSGSITNSIKYIKPHTT